MPSLQEVLDNIRAKTRFDIGRASDSDHDNADQITDLMGSIDLTTLNNESAAMKFTPEVETFYNRLYDEQRADFMQRLEEKVAKVKEQRDLARDCHGRLEHALINRANKLERAKKTLAQQQYDQERHAKEIEAIAAEDEEVALDQNVNDHLRDWTRWLRVWADKLLDLVELWDDIWDHFDERINGQHHDGEDAGVDEAVGLYMKLKRSEASIRLARGRAMEHAKSITRLIEK